MKDIKQKKTPSEIHKNHRKRMKETYLKSGFESMSDVEKLEFMLFFAIGRKDTNPIAHRLIDTFGSFQSVLEAPICALATVEGMGEHSAIFINSLLNICASYGTNKCIGEIYGTKNASEIAVDLFKGCYHEKLFVICLNKSNKILNVRCVGCGTASEINIDIRDITKAAIENKCERILLVHNHPKGSAFPSDEDTIFTNKVMLSCIINDIEIIDHLIVAGENVFSFEASGVLSEIKRDVVKRIPDDKIYTKNKKYFESIFDSSKRIASMKIED